MKTISFHLVACLFFLSLSFAVDAQKRKPVKRQSHNAVAKKTTTGEEDMDDHIKNGIVFKSNGFKVSDAYLFYDDENPVPADNKVDLNKNINMLLIIDSGWTEVGGRVYPGSKQVLKLSNGNEILNSDELFAAFNETGVSTEDAKYITLNTIVTDLKDKNKHVTVNFRVWDKKGNSEITGSYKLFIK